MFRHDMVLLGLFPLSIIPRIFNGTRAVSHRDAGTGGGLFKNGRMDIRFTSEDYAREFVSSYLGTVWNSLYRILSCNTEITRRFQQPAFIL